MADCIFCKIISGDIPSEKLFENENLLIIQDINPQSNKHFLIIPKKHFQNLKKIDKENSEIIGECMHVIGSLYEKLGLQEGFRVVINSGINACQSVYHTHIHVLGGNQLSEKMC